jgi:hypothetical protein
MKPSHILIEDTQVSSFPSIKKPGHARFLMLGTGIRFHRRFGRLLPHFDFLTQATPWLGFPIKF